VASAPAAVEAPVVEEEDKKATPTGREGGREGGKKEGERDRGWEEGR